MLFKTTGILDIPHLKPGTPQSGKPPEVKHETPELGADQYPPTSWRRHAQAVSSKVNATIL